jgi:hypothetical protein
MKGHPELLIERAILLAHREADFIAKRCRNLQDYGHQGLESVIAAVLKPLLLEGANHHLGKPADWLHS